MDAPSSARGSGEGIGRIRATSVVARGRAVRRPLEKQGEIPRHGATMTSREGSSRARARARSTSGAPPTACSRGMASPASRRPCLRARRAAGGRVALRRALRRARCQHVASRRPYHQPFTSDGPRLKAETGGEGSDSYPSGQLGQQGSYGLLSGPIRSRYNASKIRWYRSRDLSDGQWRCRPTARWAHRLARRPRSVDLLLTTTRWPS
jgi:hypothetical protein